MAAHWLAFPTSRGGGKSDFQSAQGGALQGFPTSSRTACGGLAPRPAFAEAKLRRTGRRTALLAGNLAAPS